MARVFLFFLFSFLRDWLINGSCIFSFGLSRWLFHLDYNTKLLSVNFRMLENRVSSLASANSTIKGKERGHSNHKDKPKNGNNIKKRKLFKDMHLQWK